MPRSSPHRVKLDPERPPLWRDGDTVQFGHGLSPRIVAEAPWGELLVRRMTEMFTLREFDVLAHQVGAPRDAARAVLAAVENLLVDATPPPIPPVWIDAAEVRDHRAGDRLRAAFIDEGVPPSSPENRAAIAVLAFDGSASARQCHGHLCDDRSHLPLAFGVDGVEIGPLVRPGLTPCLSCRDAHARDDDPAWPLLHAQRVRRGLARIPLTRVATAAALAVDLLRSQTPGAWFRLSGAARVETHSVTFHAECRCREQMFRSRPGSGTDRVPLGPPLETMSERGIALPA